MGFYFNCTPGTKPAKEKLTGFVGKDEHASRFGFTVDFQVSKRITLFLQESYWSWLNFVTSWLSCWTLV